MPVSLESREVGSITVIKCGGRLVEGAECEALHRHLNDALRDRPFVILNLGEVDFVDSSALGLIVRFHARARTAGGHLELCGVGARIRQILSVTRLDTVLEAHESEDEAISSCYAVAVSGGRTDRFGVDILCVDRSVDVLAFVRELLKQQGYGVVAATNLPDALILLKATRPKMVVIGADLRAARDTSTAQTFNQLAEPLSVVTLSPDFSSYDAGIAGQQLLEQVRSRGLGR